jgi:hypothetical protein
MGGAGWVRLPCEEGADTHVRYFEASIFVSPLILSENLSVANCYCALIRVSQRGYLVEAHSTFLSLIQLLSYLHSLYVLHHINSNKAAVQLFAIIFTSYKFHLVSITIVFTLDSPTARSRK